MRGQSIVATLTYADDQLPKFASLSKRDVQLFWKRLRFVVAKRGGDRFSYDIVGEYSPGVLRPHYHACLFGYWPPDAKSWSTSQSGNEESVSDELTQAWGKGRVTFQPFSTAGAGYVAGHQVSKLSGHASEARLQVRDINGQVIAQREPEFHLMSKRPGIGRTYMEAHGRQALLNGFTYARGKKEVALPKYFVEIGKKLFPEEAEIETERRKQFAKSHPAESFERLEVMEEVAQLSIKAARERKVR